MSCCIIYTCSILQKDLCIPSLNFFPFPIAFFVPFVSSFSLTLPYLYYHPFPYSFFFPSLFSIFVTRLSGNLFIFCPFSNLFHFSPDGWQGHDKYNLPNLQTEPAQLCPVLLVSLVLYSVCYGQYGEPHFAKKCLFKIKEPMVWFHIIYRITPNKI